jgi:hypothetical protein
MTKAVVRQLAVWASRLSIFLLPPALRHWGVAMQYEVEAINKAERALLFAIGCLGFALRQAVVFHVRRLFPDTDTLSRREALSMTWNTEIFQHPKKMAGLCAILATGLGLFYMHIGGAPARYLAMNAGALILGFVIVGMMALCARSVRPSAGAIALMLAGILLVTSLFGVGVHGATRWIGLGGLFVQTSLLIMPVMVLCFARVRDVLSTMGMVVAALAMALQPDRAMSGALAVGVLVLAFLKPERNVMIAMGAALCGFIAAMVQADHGPAMPFVDQIFFSAFDIHPLAGMAVLAGAALMIVPALVGYVYQRSQRETYAVFGATWFVIVIAAALGNYPTPLVGYGGSAIIGYLLCLPGLPKRSSLHALDRQDAATRPNPPEVKNLFVGRGNSFVEEPAFGN